MFHNKNLKTNIFSWALYSIGAMICLSIMVGKFLIAFIGLSIMLGFFAGMFNSIYMQLKELNTNIIGNRSKEMGDIDVSCDQKVCTCKNKGNKNDGPQLLKG